MRTTNQNKSRRKAGKIRETSGELPDRLKKSDCMYLDGEVTSNAHGTYHVSLTNGLTAICTARKLENLKVGLMPGDVIVVEVPLLSLNPNEIIRGRVVWRKRNTYK